MNSSKALNAALLVGGLGLAGFAFYKMSQKIRKPGDGTTSLWAAGDILERNQDGQFYDVLTIAKITSPGHYQYWNGWYGHYSYPELYPIMDWTLYATTDGELAQYDINLIAHVDLPVGV